MTLAHRLVAHRGYMDHFPENTLCALKAAIDAGARMLEFDLQLTADKVPVLLHDATLERTTGLGGCIMKLKASELGRYSAHYPVCFGERFRPEPIPTLSDTVAFLNAFPALTAFVEIKRQSLTHFGISAVVDRLMEDLREARFHWVLISFQAQALRYARASHGSAIGWVLPEHSPAGQNQAQALQADYLFSDRERQATLDLWPGPWRWCVYDIREAQVALALFERGVDLIETGSIAEMIESLKGQTLR